LAPPASARKAGLLLIPEHNVSKLRGGELPSARVLSCKFDQHQLYSSQSLWVSRMVGHDAVELQYLPGRVNFPAGGEVQRIGPPEGYSPGRRLRLAWWDLLALLRWGELLRWPILLRRRELLRRAILLSRRELLRRPRLLDLSRRLHLLGLLKWLSRSGLDLPRLLRLSRLLELLRLLRLTRLLLCSFLAAMVRVSEAFEPTLIAIVFVVKTSLAAFVAVISRLLAPRERGCQKGPHKSQEK